MTGPEDPGPGPGDPPPTGLGLADPAQEARLLTRIVETISACLDLDEILPGIAALVTETTHTDVCLVHLLDEAGQHLVLRGATPPFHRLAGQVELKMGEGVPGWVAAHGRPAVIAEGKLSDERYAYVPELRDDDFTSMASVPIHGKGKPRRLVGVLDVHTRERRAFTDADVRLLGRIAGLMAGAIENAHLHRRLAQREEAGWPPAWKAWPGRRAVPVRARCSGCGSPGTRPSGGRKRPGWPGSRRARAA